MALAVYQDISIGDNIKKARHRAGYTQEQLAARLQLTGCDLTRGTLAKIEAGVRHIRVSELRALVEALETDYNALFAELPDENAAEDSL